MTDKEKLKKIEEIARKIAVQSRNTAALVEQETGIRMAVSLDELKEMASESWENVQAVNAGMYILATDILSVIKQLEEADGEVDDSGRDQDGEAASGD